VGGHRDDDVYEPERADLGDEQSVVGAARGGRRERGERE
jgi:hypothetical protein